MGSPLTLKLLGLSLWLYLASTTTPIVSQNPPAVAVVNGTVQVDSSVRIATTDQDFICATIDWWPPAKCDYGTCSWGTTSILNLDLSNKILLNAIKAFSPLKIRLGGTLQDKVRYQTSADDSNTPCAQFVSNTSELFGFTQGCLPMSRWDELNNFFKMAGAKVIFGLNALSGRTVGPNGRCWGAWNSSNAESLMRHTVKDGYAIYAWELGNELSGNGIGARVGADQYASDIITLETKVNDIYTGEYNQIDRPLVMGPGGLFDAIWFKQFLRGTRASASFQAITHHIYNLGPGVDDRLIEKILDPSYLDGGAQTFKDLQNMLKSLGGSTVAWVGEAGGAYNSGHNLVTNAFISSFWYLDQLGMSSSYDTKTYCKQSLIGGNYGLLNTTTFLPNPDYYSALLWHRLMGRNVLSTNFEGSNKIRAYAHCSKYSSGITLLLINLDSATEFQVGVSIGHASANQILKLETMSDEQTPKEASTRFQGRYRFNQVVPPMREEYHLTAKDGDLHSQTMLLNGHILNVDSRGLIPHLEPKRVNLSHPIIVAPLSIVFAHIPSSTHLTACR